ncbi:Ff.00g004420.m01.CDS01 [Fusarium sp. VM40]|nr:Ff.00g004420.m01.CDS01 [Fusarium sp. VM40]
MTNSKFSVVARKTTRCLNNNPNNPPAKKVRVPLATNDQPATESSNDGWGSRPIFQSSYRLGMDPDSIEEGNAILDAFIEYEMANNNAEKE